MLAERIAPQPMKRRDAQVAQAENPSMASTLLERSPKDKSGIHGGLAGQLRSSCPASAGRARGTLLCSCIRLHPSPDEALTQHLQAQRLRLTAKQVHRLGPQCKELSISAGGL